MSKIGKKIIKCPENVNISFNVLPNQKVLQLTVVGKLGQVKIKLNSLLIDALDFINLSWVSDKKTVNQLAIKFKQSNESKLNTSLWGSFRTLINNAIKSVSQGSIIQLELVGLGYRAFVKNNTLFLLLGYSHGIQYTIPPEIDIICIKPTLISIFGLDKQQVHKIAANIKQFRPPEPYKGKGIRYINEFIQVKEGKKK